VKRKGEGTLEGFGGVEADKRSPVFEGPGGGLAPALAFPVGGKDGRTEEGSGARAPVPPVAPAIAGHTTLISPRLLESRSVPQDVKPAESAKKKPVVGWLVVTIGPGRGQVFSLTYGINQIGSRVENGIQLNFGDLQIADIQALVIYDHQRRKFFVHHKGGRVATFLGGEPVLKLTPVAPHQEIVMGRTRLRLVPLCGPDFDWTQK
jgi:hypothetical protein